MIAFRRLLPLLFLALLLGCQQTPTTGGPTPTLSPSKLVPSTTASPAASPTVTAEPVDVLIVGAGLCGLTTAYQLKQAGISFRVLELTPRVGGRARTASYPDETQAEVGLAEFWTGNPAIDLARELKVELELVEPGMSSFMVDGKLYPFTDYDSNQDFIKATLAKDYPQYQTWDKRMEDLVHQVESGKIPPELMKLKDVSFEDWLEKEALSPFARKLVKAVIEPEIGTSIKRISALDGIAEWHLFVGRGATPHHCVGGNEKLPLALARAIGEENISLNTQVTNVIDGPDGVEVRAVDAANFDAKVFKAKYVVLTVPLYRLFEIQFVPRLDEKVYQAIHTQTWGAYFTAHCLLDRAAEKYWTVNGNIVLPILSGGALGCIYPGHDVGPKDKVMLNFLVTGAHAEEFNSRTMSLDDVQNVMEKAMEQTWPGSKAMIKRWTFYRYHPRAIASWPVGRSRFDELSEGLRKPHGRIYFGGDFTESSHSDGAMRSALRMSGQIKAVLEKK
ncbi:NAD(P)/FAD-dependent oxidoreductase [bacterium CPR1]|nr:NAD(P)/FAD-dependent oxidoreductase [bacterium CPR1]